MSNDPRNSAAAPAKANLEAARSRVMQRLAVAALLAAFALFAMPAAVEARSLALVIGQDAYVNVPALRTAVGDARAVGDQLEKMGFIVRRALNVDQRAMSRALVAFEGELQPGDRALFFYAGHGFEISGANYLLPTDVPTAQANRIGIVRDAAFSVESIIDGIRESGARLTVLVLDACRDNPFAPSGRAGAKTGGLARVDAPEGVFVLMSAGAKQEALDRLSNDESEKNSVFTRTFLVELAKPGRTLVEIAKATQVGVKTLAATIGYEQTPAYYDQVIGDIVLSDAPANGPAASPALVAQATSTSTSTSTPAPAPMRQEVAALSPDPKLAEALKVGGHAPIANFMRSNAGWTVTLSLPEPATAISYRIGDAGEFKSTGLTDIIDQRTGERKPNPSFPMSSRTPTTIIQVRYDTPDGSVGPIAIRFDPEAALFHEEKQILESLATSWVEFREFNGTLIYFTSLISYRCAIAEVRYGLDDGKPLQRYDMPACNPKDPFVIPPNAQVYIKAPPQTKSISVQITWRDGTQSDVSKIERD
jgi:hypothetical protein